METAKDFALTAKGNGRGRDGADENTVKGVSVPAGGKGAYWIWAIIQGKLFVDGAYDNPDRAYSIGYEKVKQQFDVEWLPTTNLQTATHIFKHRLLEHTGDISRSMQRAKHKT